MFGTSGSSPPPVTGGLPGRYGSVSAPPRPRAEPPVRCAAVSASTASTGRDAPAESLEGAGAARRLAVIDLGSNTFRLVVFRYRTGASFQLVDEVREPVRLSAGSDERGIAVDALDRARHATRLYADFCRAAGIADVLVLATSAARDAPNRDEVLRALSADGALTVSIISEEEEARYGYLGAVNSTTLSHGYVLDVGGGSLQVSRVRDRRLVAHASRPLGAVRMTERFLGGDQTSPADVAALRTHVAAELDAIGFFTRRGGRLVGLGGTIRTLGAMGQRREGYPLRTVHGYVLTRETIRLLIDEMAALPASQRSRIRGLKRDRADVTLGGALVVEAALDRAGADRLEICGQGLREGAFYEHFLAPADPPLIPDVRRQSVLNLAANLGYDRPHADHVARLSIALHTALARAGVHRPSGGDHELLWAAAMLHDVGVLVDYHDHQRHSHYLVLNAGLPGFRHRELALIALLVRGHRKALPEPGDLLPLLWPGDEALLDRLAACLRVAEQLERGRARGVTGLEVEDDGERTRLIVDAVDDPALAIWSASLEAPAFERAFDRRLVVEAAARPR